MVAFISLKTRYAAAGVAQIDPGRSLYYVGVILSQKA